MSRWQTALTKAKQFDPRSISGLALWLDAADSSTLYTTDAGPVTAVSSPLDIAGCGLWLDASNAGSLTLNGNTVSEWRDLSGNARHFSQATPASQPNAVNRTQNGLRVLDFQGAQELLGNAASLNILRNVGGATIMAAVRWDVVDSSTRIAFRVSVSTSNTSRASLLTGQFPNQMSVVGRRLDADASTSASGVVAAGSYVVTGVIDYANTDGFLYNNGSTLGQNLSFLTAGNTDDTNSALVNVGAQNFDGWIGEIIVWPRVLTATERARAEAYLAAKWGISGVHAPATATNDPVGAWLDKSGSGRHATQALSASRVARSFTINGRTALSSSTSGWMTISAFPLVYPATAFTVAILPGGNCAVFQVGAVNQIYSLLASTISARDTLQVRRSASAQSTGLYATNTPRVIAAFYSTNLSRGRVAGVALGADQTATVSHAAGDYGVSLFRLAESSFVANVTIGEFLLYSGVVPNAQAQQIERYLAAKWGAALYSPPTYADADVNTYISAVEIADGAVALEPGVRDAINDFVVGCKADGIWSAIKAGCILAGARTLAGALVPLVGSAPTNFNFVSGDYNRKTGLKGDGTTKYLNTNRNANADPQNNFHFAFRLSEAIAATSVTAGAGGGSTGSTQIQGNQFRCRNLTGDQPTVPMGTVSLHGMSRSDAAEYVARCGGTSQTFTRASQTPFNGNLFTHARLSGGTAGLFSAMRINYYSIGESVNLATLESRVQTLVNAIGAAIP